MYAIRGVDTETLRRRGEIRGQGDFEAIYLPDADAPRILHQTLSRPSRSLAKLSETALAGCLPEKRGEAGVRGHASVSSANYRELFSDAEWARRSREDMPMDAYRRVSQRQLYLHSIRYAPASVNTFE